LATIVPAAEDDRALSTGSGQRGGRKSKETEAWGSRNAPHGGAGT
jgi:hypothetical protein